MTDLHDRHENLTEKIYNGEKINEKDSLKDLEFDSLNVLDLQTFNDSNFKDLDIAYETFEKWKTIKDLIKLYGNKINWDIKIFLTKYKK